MKAGYRVLGIVAAAIAGISYTWLGVGYAVYFALVAIGVWIDGHGDYIRNRP
jgi:hypothetical protein